MIANRNFQFILKLDNPYLLSAVGHFALVAALVVGIRLVAQLPVPIVDFEVIESPTLAPEGAKPLSVGAIATPKPKAALTPRAVFGASPKTVGDIAVKPGNTVATAPDERELLPSDATRLPIPADEYLITAMPVLLREVRIPYPPEARAKGIAGAVVMDLLIDREGSVRESRLIEGPGFGLSAAALEAVMQLKFKPARIAEQSVAVRIRYIYRFVLER